MAYDAECEMPLAPIVGPQYCCPFSVELTVSKKALSLSGGSFDITDADGNVIFKMDGHALSIRDKRVLLDAAGNPILCAHKKLASLHDTWEVCIGDNCDEANKLFTVKKSSFFQLKTSLDVFLASNDDDEAPNFRVKGDFFERNAEIYQGEQLIAEVKRKYTVENVLLDKHTFVVVVFPGIDQAFIATLIIIMDAIHED